MKTGVPSRLLGERIELCKVSECQPETINRLFDVSEPEEVFSQCSWSRHDSIAETLEYIEERDIKWDNHEQFSYAVILRRSREFAGTTYLKVDSPDGEGVIGLWLDKPYWGDGLSGERVDLLLEVAFNYLSLTHVSVGCLAENTQSRAAIEKYVRRHGGVYCGTVPVTASKYCESQYLTKKHHEYAIRQRDYESDVSGIGCLIPSVSYETVKQNMK